ncbi:MAG: hypothetical protein AAFO07_15775, partial [Bacteroidota bacterium]
MLKLYLNKLNLKSIKGLKKLSDYSFNKTINIVHVNDSVEKNALLFAIYCAIIHVFEVINNNENTVDLTQIYKEHLI